MAKQGVSQESIILTDEDLSLTFHATYSDSVNPFRISVKQDFLDQTRLKASLTRFMDAEFQRPNNEPEFIDGPPTHAAKTIASHWASVFDWRHWKRNQLSTNPVHNYCAYS